MIFELTSHMGRPDYEPHWPNGYYGILRNREDYTVWEGNIVRDSPEAALIDARNQSEGKVIIHANGRTWLYPH